jgi:cyclophilin family peptidyl-prolyl cis-trans isomerase
MAEHKAPTDVTVVAYEEKSALVGFVEKHWIKAAVAAALLTAFILWQQYQRGQEAARVDESWNKLMAAVDETPNGGFIGDPAVLQTLSTELEGTIAGPWALFLRAQSLREEGSYDEAVAALLQLKKEYPEHPLVRDIYKYGDAVTPLSAVEHLSKVFEGEKEWRETQPGLFGNPEPPADAARVRIVTEHGDILLALYSDRAPLHSANFLAQVEAGVYDGLLFHRASMGDGLKTGDPATAEPESNRMTWGRGESEGFVEAEDSSLSHFGGFLSATPAAGGEGSSKSLITITANGNHALDTNHVVFGKVIEGIDVVVDIASHPVDQAQTPLEPVKITSMAVIPGA